MRRPWKACIVVELDNLLCSRYDVESVADWRAHSLSYFFLEYGWSVHCPLILNLDRSARGREPKRDHEENSSGNGRDRSHMIPQRPTGNVFSPQPRALWARRIECRQGVVARYVEYDRHQKCAQQIECAANKNARRARLLPVQQRGNDQNYATNGSPKKQSKKHRIKYRYVDRFHGCDALRRWQSRQCSHHEC